MPTAPSNGIEIYYVEEGDPDGEPLLLIMGLGAQLTLWPQPLVDDLAGRGFRVIRLDNRDCGLSTHFDGMPGDLARSATDPSQAPYQLTDLAADAVGLLDHLGIDRAHLVGASMGGMIAQVLALDYPDRVRSLCSIMSTTGDPQVGQSTQEALAALMAPVPAGREAAIAHLADVQAVLGSRTYPLDPAEARRQFAESYDRAFYPEGTARQGCAILAAPDRTERLGGVKVPTVVIHGGQDPLIQPSGGRATAAAIPGAELVELDGMGHDLPTQLLPAIADAIERTAVRATTP